MATSKERKFKKGDTVCISFKGARHIETEYEFGWSSDMTSMNWKIGKVIELVVDGCRVKSGPGDSYYWHISALRKARKWNIKKAKRKETLV